MSDTDKITSDESDDITEFLEFFPDLEGLTREELLDLLEECEEMHWQLEQDEPFEEDEDARGAWEDQLYELEDNIEDIWELLGDLLEGISWKNEITMGGRTMLTQTINDVLVMLDADEYPEIFAYLASQTDDDRIGADEPYIMANKLLDLDKPGDLPPFVIDLIEELFTQAIETGNAEAMNDLGAQYYGGNRGFGQSFRKAADYFEMAAQNGSRQAQENLGYIYYYGRLGKPDYEKAFHCFALGAFDGHLISLYKIGDMYLNGLYVPKNEREAFFIFVHCVETMTQEAESVVAGPVYLRLGRMFLSGTGTEPDAKSALVCFQKAESFLYDMVKNGGVMYKKSLASAIEGQAKARQKLMSELPNENWTFD